MGFKATTKLGQVGTVAQGNGLHTARPAISLSALVLAGMVRQSGIVIAQRARHGGTYHG
jgi:hypothetical protein